MHAIYVSHVGNAITMVTTLMLLVRSHFRPNVKAAPLLYWTQVASSVEVAFGK